MLPFSSETKLSKEPKLSYLMRCEFLFVSLLTCAECNTVESARYSDRAENAYDLLVTQRDQRIDFGGASGGDVAGEQSGEDHTECYGAKCDRIGRRDFK